MPYFSLSLPKKKTKRNTNTNKYRLIEKDVEGIVVISLKAMYSVSCKIGTIPITRESYSCKNKNAIYHQLCGNNSRICYIRYKDKKYECNGKLWLPFAPGCIVKGNIVESEFGNKFDIKNTWIDPDNIDAHNAFKFFKDNYEQISKVLREKIYNGI